MILEGIQPKIELEDFGVMTEEWDDTVPTYDLRSLFHYCRSVGKEPIDLTDKERDQFRTN